VSGNREFVIELFLPGSFSAVWQMLGKPFVKGFELDRFAQLGRGYFPLDAALFERHEEGALAPAERYRNSESGNQAFSA
jgi:hypothetical protein